MQRKRPIRVDRSLPLFYTVYGGDMKRKLNIKLTFIMHSYMFDHHIVLIHAA